MAIRLNDDIDESGEMYDINVTPFIDVMLVLLIIFMVAAIPAVVIYNIFARTITSYRHQVGDVAAQIILLQGRDLDLAASEGDAPRGQTGQLRVG